MTEDRIYSRPLTKVGTFEFDDQVAEVFPDMIARSVPGYASMLSMVEQVASDHATPGSNLYDLGCSLGAASLKMANSAPSSCTVHAIDSSAAMISRLNDRLVEDAAGRCKVKTHEADMRDVTIENASVVVLNLTLQFIPSAERTSVLQSAYSGMLNGGALLLSEKVCFDDPAEQQLMTDLHLAFKRAHGYSELEIAQKRTALENTLVPETEEQHLRRLRSCGFQRCGVWFRCFNFASMIAVRDEC